MSGVEEELTNEKGRVGYGSGRSGAGVVQCDTTSRGAAVSATERALFGGGGMRRRRRSRRSRRCRVEARRAPSQTRKSRQRRYALPSATAQDGGAQGSGMVVCAWATRMVGGVVVNVRFPERKGLR